MTHHSDNTRDDGQETFEREGERKDHIGIGTVMAL